MDVTSTQKEMNEFFFYNTWVLNFIWKYGFEKKKIPNYSKICLIYPNSLFKAQSNHLTLFQRSDDNNILSHNHYRTQLR